MNNIKLGEIKYSSFNKVWKERENKGVFQEKLKILLFNNEEDFTKCIKILTNLYDEIVKQRTSLENIISVFNEFYKKKFKNELAEAEILKTELLSGNINHFENKDIIKKIDEFKEIFKKLPEEEDIKN